MDRRQGKVVEVLGGSLYKCQPRASFLRLRSFETLLRLEIKKIKVQELEDVILWQSVESH